MRDSLTTQVEDLAVPSNFVLSLAVETRGLRADSNSLTSELATIYSLNGHLVRGAQRVAELKKVLIEALLKFPDVEERFKE